MTYEQFIVDAHQLNQYLKERFDKEKIYLLGHSWENTAWVRAGRTLS